MTTSESAKVAALVVAIFVAAFGAAYLVATVFDVEWLKDLLTPHLGRRTLPFPWNLLALLALVTLGFLIKRSSKRGL